MTTCLANDLFMAINPISEGQRQVGLSEAIASAHRVPLTMALSRLGGHPVSVQAPATSKLAIGLRWMGRCDFAPGLSERIPLGIIRRRIEEILLSGLRSPKDLSSSRGITSGFVSE